MNEKDPNIKPNQIMPSKDLENAKSMQPQEPSNFSIPNSRKGSESIDTESALHPPQDQINIQTELQTNSNEQQSLNQVDPNNDLRKIGQQFNKNIKVLGPLASDYLESQELKLKNTQQQPDSKQISLEQVQANENSIGIEQT
eukprot:403375127